MNTPISTFRSLLISVLISGLVASRASLAVPLDGAAPTRNDYVGDAEYEQILAQLRDEAQHSIQNPANYVSDEDLEQLLQRLVEETTPEEAKIGDQSAGEANTPAAPLQSTTEQLAAVTQAAASDSISTPLPIETTTAPKSQLPRWGTSIASDRLMRELKKVYKSDYYKRGLYTVELVDENLFDWRVKLSAAMFDESSKLHRDFVDLESRSPRNKLELSFTFSDDYPFEPPFVRIVYPIIAGDGVFAGGTICMDLFTRQGWSSTYMIEGSIVQIAMKLTELKTKISSSDPAYVAEHYTPEMAKEGFEYILDHHPEWK